METTINRQEITNIKDCVEYKASSIVSNIVSKNTTSCMTVYAFDRGQSITPITDASDIIVQVLEGTAEVMVNMHNYDIADGDVIVMPKDKPHALFAKTKLKIASFRG